MDLNDKKIPKYRTPFRAAVEGLFATIRQERNFRFHLLAAFCACLLGFFFSFQNRMDRHFNFHFRRDRNGADEHSN